MLRRLSSALASGLNSLHFQSTRTMSSSRVFIEAAELQRKISSSAPPTLIDTRPAEDHSLGRIGDAVCVPEFLTKLLADSSDSSLRAFRGELLGLLSERGVGSRGAVDEVVVYEESMDTAKGASCRGAVLLRHLGFSSVSVLQGGVEAWRAEGLELTTGAPPTPSAGDLTWLRPSEALLATSAEVAAALGDGRTGILDDRDTDEWLGKASAPPGAPECPRKGRIPGAKWLLWTRLMEKDSKGVLRVKRPEEVRSICAEAGFADLDQPIVIYCFKGARASNTLLAMEAAGFTRLRNFLGSWNEWSRNPDLPVDDRLLS